MTDIDRSAVRTWPEVVDALPPLSQAERRALEQNIRDYGVIYPVLVIPDGRIIDGHHRWDIAAGTAPLRIIDISPESAKVLALALNVDRRQLSPEQRREAVARLDADKAARREAVIILRNQGLTQEQVGQKYGVDQSTIDRWEDGDESIMQPHNAFEPPDQRVSVPKAEHSRIHERHKGNGETLESIAADYHVTPQRLGQIVREYEARQRQPGAAGDVALPDGTFRCIVIDPPWPMQKIEREVHPDQGVALDYPVMSLAEIEGVPVEDFANEDGCHIYLWVTQKFLPDGLRLIEAWGFRYQCLLTWVKPSGFTPFSWMYNTEHVVFGRRGSLDLEKLGLKLSFEAPVTRHSAKPNIFYQRVIEASPGPRLEMFARTPRDGFVVWGNEVASHAS